MLSIRISNDIFNYRPLRMAELGRSIEMQGTKMQPHADLSGPLEGKEGR